MLSPVRELCGTEVFFFLLYVRKGEQREEWSQVRGLQDVHSVSGDSVLGSTS